MKLMSWNVNGIRSVHTKGFLKWFAERSGDIICLQEVKATTEQLNEELLHPMGYHSIWNPAEKLGYSGVAVYSKKEPLSVTLGLGDPELDREGRVIRAEYKDFVLINAYFPNSQREGLRLPFKLKFCDQMLRVFQDYDKQGKNIVICGDFNIAHKEIDLKNPKTNTKNAGFLPEERAWLDKITSMGYVDAFRKFEQGPDHYTWWSYRPTIRERNIGWRIDYFFSNKEFSDRITSCIHEPETTGSDHCPVVLTTRN